MKKLLMVGLVVTFIFSVSISIPVFAQIADLGKLAVQQAVEGVIIPALKQAGLQDAVIQSLVPQIEKGLKDAIAKQYDSVGKLYAGVAQSPQDVAKLLTDTTNKIIGGSLPSNFAISKEQVGEMGDKMKGVLLTDTNWIETTRNNAVNAVKEEKQKETKPATNPNEVFVDSFIKALESYGFDEATAIELTGELFDKNKDLIFSNKDVEDSGITYASASGALNK